MKLYSILNILLGLLLAPFMFSVINRVKALWAGRKGQPLLQPYYDLIKLLFKEPVYSITTTWIFKAGPVIGLSVLILSLMLVPFNGQPALFSFAGDFFLLIYLLALMRFFIIVSALDTGSAFEGMGASREAFFSALAEPAFAVGLITLVKMTGEMSLSGCFNAFSVLAWQSDTAPLILVLIAWGIVFLTENARVPIDDPNTHLELTMIHEVMALDHSGFELFCIQYASALKMWVIGALLVNIIVPIHTGNVMIDLLFSLIAMFFLCIVTGTIESAMARLRLNRIPQLLIAADSFSLLALIIIIRNHTL